MRAYINPVPYRLAYTAHVPFYIMFCTTAPVTAGEKFLAANAKKEGVKTTSSGLQYKIIKEGNGAIPTDSSKDQIKILLYFAKAPIISVSQTASQNC